MEQAWTKSFQNKRHNDAGFMYIVYTYIYICVCVCICMYVLYWYSYWYWYWYWYWYCIVIIVCMCVKINWFYCFFTLQFSKISIEMGAFIHFIDDLSLFICLLQVVIFHSYVQLQESCFFFEWPLPTDIISDWYYTAFWPFILPSVWHMFWQFISYSIFSGACDISSGLSIFWHFLWHSIWHICFLNWHSIWDSPRMWWKLQSNFTKKTKILNEGWVVVGR